MTAQLGQVGLEWAREKEREEEREEEREIGEGERNRGRRERGHSGVNMGYQGSDQPPGGWCGIFMGLFFYCIAILVI